VLSVSLFYPFEQVSPGPRSCWAKARASAKRSQPPGCTTGKIG
jgi:hypothetical protein